MICAIKLRGFGCHRMLDLDLYRRRIAVIAGPTASGKTTVARAVRWCLTGAAPPVTDRGGRGADALITEGANPSDLSVTVQLAAGRGTRTLRRTRRLLKRQDTEGSVPHGTAADAVAAECGAPPWLVHAACGCGEWLPAGAKGTVELSIPAATSEIDAWREGRRQHNRRLRALKGIAILADSPWGQMVAGISPDDVAEAIAAEECEVETCTERMATAWADAFAAGEGESWGGRVRSLLDVLGVAQKVHIGPDGMSLPVPGGASGRGAPSRSRGERVLIDLAMRAATILEGGGSPGFVFVDDADALDRPHRTALSRAFTSGRIPLQAIVLTNNPDVRPGTTSASVSIVLGGTQKEEAAA